MIKKLTAAAIIALFTLGPMSVGHAFAGMSNKQTTATNSTPLQIPNPKDTGKSS